MSNINTSRNFLGFLNQDYSKNIQSHDYSLTQEAEIISLDNPYTKKYYIKYLGTIRIAFAQENRLYHQGDKVKILISPGKDTLILSLVENERKDSIVDKKYNFLGNPIFTQNNSKTEEESLVYNITNYDVKTKGYYEFNGEPKEESNSFLEEIISHWDWRVGESNFIIPSKEYSFSFLAEGDIDINSRLCTKTVTFSQTLNESIFHQFSSLLEPSASKEITSIEIILKGDFVITGKIENGGEESSSVAYPFSLVQSLSLPQEDPKSNIVLKNFSSLSSVIININQKEQTINLKDSYEVYTAIKKYFSITSIQYNFDIYFNVNFDAPFGIFDQLTFNMEMEKIQRAKTYPYLYFEYTLSLKDQTRQEVLIGRDRLIFRLGDFLNNQISGGGYFPRGELRQNFIINVSESTDLESKLNQLTFISPDLDIKDLKVWLIENSIENLLFRINVNKNIGIGSTDTISLQANLRDGITSLPIASYLWFKRNYAVINEFSIGYSELGGIGWSILDNNDGVYEIKNDASSIKYDYLGNKFLTSYKSIITDEKSNQYEDETIIQPYYLLKEQHPIKIEAEADTISFKKNDEGILKADFSYSQNQGLELSDNEKISFIILQEPLNSTRESYVEEARDGQLNRARYLSLMQLNNNAVEVNFNYDDATKITTIDLGKDSIKQKSLLRIKVCLEKFHQEETGADSETITDDRYQIDEIFAILSKTSADEVTDDGISVNLIYFN